MEECGFVAKRQDNSWEVELATDSKVVVDSLVCGCALDLGTFTTTIYLYVFPLVSYGVLLYMDWLDSYRTCISYQHRLVKCLDYLGERVEPIGVQRPISLCMISFMQMK